MTVRRMAGKKLRITTDASVVTEFLNRELALYPEAACEQLRQHRPNAKVRNCRRFHGHPTL